MNEQFFERMNKLLFTKFATRDVHLVATNIETENNPVEMIYKIEGQLAREPKVIDLKELNNNEPKEVTVTALNIRASLYERGCCTFKAVIPASLLQPKAKWGKAKLRITL